MHFYAPTGDMKSVTFNLKSISPTSSSCTVTPPSMSTKTHDADSALSSDYLVGAFSVTPVDCTIEGYKKTAISSSNPALDPSWLEPIM